MELKKTIEAEDAVAVIHDGDVVASSGSGGNGTPDWLCRPDRTGDFQR